LVTVDVVEQRLARFALPDGFVSVGVDHDTPVLAVTTIKAWWELPWSDRVDDVKFTVYAYY
jgi:hypothetical protein